MRVVIVPSFKKPEITKKLLDELLRDITYLAMAIKTKSSVLYSDVLRELSEILPYPLVRKLDEKLPITLCWQDVYYPSTETKELLFKKLLETTVSDLQYIVDEFSKFFKIKLPNIEHPINLYLEGKITEPTILLNRLRELCRT